MLGMRRKGREQVVDARSRIVADLSGAAISGQVAVGENIVQIHAEHGAIVNYLAPEERPVPRLRLLPVQRLPRDFPDLLGRDRELAEARAAISQSLPAEFHGEPGVGKSALLRHLSHHSGEEPRDGTVHMTCEGQTVEDLLQFVFDAFFESGKVKLLPTAAELRGYLLERRALLIFDDFERGREELERLMNSAPSASFLTASTSRCLWGEGRSVALGALDESPAIALLEHELGRSLSDAERLDATRLCKALGGRPLRLLRAAALLREGAISLADLTQAPSSPEVSRALNREAIATLSAPEHTVFELLAALPGIALSIEHLAAITGVEEAGSVLQELERRGLVQSHSPSYTVAGGVEDAALLDPRKADQLRAATRSHLAGSIAAHRDPRGHLDEAQTIVTLLDWGKRAKGGDQPQQVLAATQAAETALALNGRWGAWVAALDHALHAAEQLQDRAATAWALHELGSRALCLGDADAARAKLTDALALREELGDSKGAALTRHNLDRLTDGPPGPPARPGPRLPRWPALLGIAAVVAVGAVVAVLASGGGGGRTPADRGRTGSNIGGASTTAGGRTTGSNVDGATTAAGRPPPAPRIELTPTSLAFDSVDLRETSSMTVTAMNTGSEPATLGPATIAGAVGGAFTWKDGCGGKALAAQDQCTVTVTFAPPDVGTFSATLSLPIPGGTRQISLSGTGVAAPSTSTPSTAAPTTSPPTTSGPTTTSPIK